MGLLKKKKLKWHISPKGVRPCNADVRDCPYKHYLTQQEAERAQAKVDDYYNQFDSESKIEKDIDSDDQMVAFKVHYNVTERSICIRREGNKFQYLKQKYGTSPKYVRLSMPTSFYNRDKSFRIYVNRSYDIYGFPARTFPKYTISVRDCSKDYRGPNPILSEEMPATSRDEVKNIKRVLYSAITDCALKTFDDEEEAYKRRDNAIDAAINTMKSIETMDRGVTKADEVGLSFFSGSDDDVLRAKVNWRETSFNENDVRQALASRRYKELSPNVDITLQDYKNGESNRGWTIHCMNDEWDVYFTDYSLDEDQVTYCGPYTEPEDIIAEFRERGWYEQMGYHETNQNLFEDSITRMVNGVRMARDEHNDDVLRNTMGFMFD